MRVRIAALMTTLAIACSAFADKISFLPFLLHPAIASVFMAGGQPGPPPDKEKDDPAKATEDRYATMRDEHGNVPPGAFLRANLHRRNTVHGHSNGRASISSASITRTSWVSRGPQDVGGRTLAILVHPTNNQILYAGSASGGIWKSTDAGQTWAPLADFMSNLFIGALAFDPTNPSTIYAGTGEKVYDGNLSMAYAGIFKSTDAGATWNQLAGTANWTSYVTAISPQPGSSSVLLASTAAGVYRSSDSGASWSQLNIANLLSANTVAFDPSNGSRAVVGGVRNDGKIGAFVSSDGGLTFSAASGLTMTHGPNNAGEIAIAYARSVPGEVFAITNDGQITIDGQVTASDLWRSVDNGQSYTLVNTGTASIGCVVLRCALWVAPNNDQLLVTGGLLVYRGQYQNGAATFQAISNPPATAKTADPHYDIHSIVSDSASPSTTVYFGTDGGIYRTNDIANANVGIGWTSLNQTYQTSQFYGAAGHAVGSGLYLGGTQDNGTLYTTNATQNATSALGEDGGFAEIDPTHPNTWYFEWPFAALYRTSNSGSTSSQILVGFDKTSSQLDAPFVLDPNNVNTLYVGGSSLYRTTNANDPSVTWTGILSGTSNIFIAAIAVAPGNPDVVYVGMSCAYHNEGCIGGGLVYKSINATAATPSFDYVDNNGSKNPLPNRSILRIYIDSANINTVYIALGGYSYDNLWKSTDGGSSFVSVSGTGSTSLPPAPVRGFVRHPRDPQRLYAGTDVGVYESEDGGATWSTSSDGPADVPIDEIRFVQGTELLLAATHGRGLWTADVSNVGNLTPMTLTATAGGTTGAITVGLLWNDVTGATYQILRASDGGALTQIDTATTHSYTDHPPAGAMTYLYRVNAVINSSVVGQSNVDLATTILFSSDYQLAGKVVDHGYLQEVRDAVNAVRAASGLPLLTFSNPASTGSPVFATDITDLRAGIIDAYNKLRLTYTSSVFTLPNPVFGESLVSHVTPVRASHWQEIREACK